MLGPTFYADHGFTVPEMIHGYWAPLDAELRANAESRRVFLPNHKIPATGQLFFDPELANALRLIADHGEDAFYKGAIAHGPG